MNKKFGKSAAAGLLIGMAVLVSGCSKTEDLTETYEPPKQIWVREADAEGELPASYDPRKEALELPVKDQGNQNACWAVSAMSALEILDKNREGNFSIEHLLNNNGFQYTEDSGGDYHMILAYLTSWKGPVYEESNGDEAVRHLQEAYFIDGQDFQEVKSAVLKYGSVQSSMYLSFENEGSLTEDYDLKHSSYFSREKMKANHAVLIVGWDDQYPKENFKVQPQNDGAFICLNSWGEGFGESGYFYVSYEDVNIAEKSLVYTRLEPVGNYDHMYQSDLLGCAGMIGYDEDHAWFANVYPSEANEHLKAAGFYIVDPDVDFEIYAVADLSDPSDLTNQAVYLSSGHCDRAGYYTVDFPEDVAVEAGNKFAVVIKIYSEKNQSRFGAEYAASEATSQVDLTDGESYMSYNGEDWKSVESDYQSNLCLKVFTDREEALNE